MTMVSDTVWNYIEMRHKPPTLSSRNFGWWYISDPDLIVAWNAGNRTTSAKSQY